MDLAKKAAVIGAGVVLGDMAFEKLVSPMLVGKGKLIQDSGIDAFGMDDVLRALTIAATVIAIQKIL